MSTERTIHHPPALQAGKAATKALIKAAGGQEEATRFTGMRSQSRLSSYGLPNTDAFMTIDSVRALEAVTHGLPGHPHVTRWLAGEAGGVFVPLPRAVLADAADWHVEMAAVSKEVGDVIQRICLALADSKVTPVEARRIRGEIQEAQEHLAMIDALAERAESEE